MTARPTILRASSPAIGSRTRASGSPARRSAGWRGRTRGLAEAAAPLVAFLAPVTEAAPRAPLNHYGRSKAEAEIVVEAARAAGLRTAIVRLVYGALNDHPDRAVPSLLWRAMAGEELRITGAANFFDFVHVEDCAEGLIAAADRLIAGGAPPAPAHLATGIPTSLGALATQCRAVAGSASPLALLPPRDFDVTGFCGDPALAAELLGWRARIRLEEGLRMLRQELAERGRPLDPVTMPVPRTHQPAAV